MCKLWNEKYIDDNQNSEMKITFREKIEIDQARYLRIKKTQVDQYPDGNVLNEDKPVLNECAIGVVYMDRKLYAKWELID